MKRPCRALLVEDSVDDATLVVMQLRRAGLDVVAERVDNAPDLAKALDRGGWDVVLSDHSMPHFSSGGVLEMLRERRLDLPCIIVSGRIGEEAAVQAMRAGAADYVGKDHLNRLDTAVTRALREAEDRRMLREAEDQLRVLESAVQNLREGVLITTGDPVAPRVIYVNRGWCTMTGYAREEVVGNAATSLGGPWSDSTGLGRLCSDPTGRHVFEGPEHLDGHLGGDRADSDGLPGPLQRPRVDVGGPGLGNSAGHEHERIHDADREQHVEVEPDEIPPEVAEGAGAIGAREPAYHRDRGGHPHRGRGEVVEHQGDGL
jgi:CheY-like chemotaxis protein